MDDNNRVVGHGNITKLKCHICGGSHLTLFELYSRLRRVTSDCKPWPSGGKLAICHSCGGIQKPVTPEWQSETECIYREYSIYHQSNGVEQRVFDQNSDRLASRSSKILQSVCLVAPLPEAGKQLDIGCGNGALLREFHDQFPKWKLFGTELNDKYKKEVESIRNVEKVYISGNLLAISETFHCITMVHVLEHIVSPQKFLVMVRNLLEEGGLLIIEVPCFQKNPYDLLIVDHSTHFTESTLSELLVNSGFQILTVSTEWVPKELTIVATKDILLEQGSVLSTIISPACNHIKRSMEWLTQNITDSMRESQKGNFGIFGTSISATWLFTELCGCTNFFVDEDPTRIGKMHMGRPIYSPKEIPEGSVVFLPFCPDQAEKIKSRLSGIKKNILFISTPKIDASSL